MDIFTLLIVQPMGWIIEMIYKFIPNYGVAIILFTLVIKAILLPLGIKSQKSMIKQQKLQPQLAELQRKYAHDKDKLNQEMMKLYKENGANPTSGCLPMLLQFPIIIGLYQVIQMPLSYVMKVNFNLAENINKVIGLQAAVLNNPVLSAIAPNGFATSDMETLANRFQIAMSNFASKIEGFADWAMNFNFCGIDLSRYPSETMGLLNPGVSMDTVLSLLPLLIIPAAAGLTSWLLSKMTPQPGAQTENKTSSVTRLDGSEPPAQDNGMAGMGKSMRLMMPIMSLVFTFTLPAGVGLYWTVSNLVQMAQQYFMTKYYKNKEDDIIVIDTVKKNRKDSKRHR